MTRHDDAEASRPPATYASPGTSDQSWLVRRAVALAGAASNFPPPQWRRRLVAVGALVFVVGAVVAASRLDLAWSQVRWHWLALAMLVGVPTTIASNALEYRLSARLLGHDVSMREAVRVAVLATAANLLPIPGGVLVRVQALKTSGQSYRDAGLSTAMVGLAWVGASATIAGAGLLAWGATGTGLTLTGGGLLALGIAAALVVQYLPPGVRLTFYTKVVAVEAAAMLAGIFRLYVVLIALGESPAVAGAAMLSLATVLSSVAGVFPGGLGLREVLATLLGPLGGVSAAAGFLATAVDRIIGLALHAPLALWISRRDTTDNGDG